MAGVILNVPYKSQNDADADAKHTDCGPCCVAMILGALGQTVTTNAVTAASGMAADAGLSHKEVIQAAQAFGLNMYWNQGFSLDDLKSFLDKGLSPIALIKYGKIPDRFDQLYLAGHFVVIVGYDDVAQQVFINDPDYPAGWAQGYQRPCSYQTFLSAWGGFVPGENVNFSLIVPRLERPIPGVGVPGKSPGATPSPRGSGDLWVIAPAGLSVRTRPDVPATPGKSGLLFGQHVTALSPEIGPDNKGTIWQKIRTDQDVVGWAAASEQGQRYLSDSKPNDPYVLYVLDTAPVRDAGALRVRDAHDINSPQVDSAQIGERLTVYHRVTDADGTPWLWVKSPRGGYGWVREKANDVLLVAPIKPEDTTDVRPFGKCLAGVGMANPQLLTPNELAVVAHSRVEAIKVLTLSDPDENRRLVRALKHVRSDLFIVARLFFPVDLGNKTPFSPQNFCDTVRAGATALYEEGIRYFEIHNEPNLEIEGLNWNWRNGAEFGDWLARALNVLRQRYPQAKFGFPGLSPQLNVPDFLESATPAVARCDWVGVHCYWQHDADGHWGMLSAQDGMYWRLFRARYPQKLLMITEFSNNARDVSYEDKGQQYARYFRLLRHEPNLGAAFAFALNWPNQDVNREGWICQGQTTAIANTLGALVGQAEYLA